MGAVVTWMALNQDGYESLLRWMFPAESVHIYQRTTLARLLGQHLAVAGLASVIALVIGLSLGVLLLTPVGRMFRDVVMDLASLGQVMPSIALIAIVVPVIGYGWEPVVLALVVYGVLPVMLNVVVGVQGVPAEMVDAARGLGMTRRQRLWRVELPLAAPVVLGGVKNMLIINVGAATLAALVGAGGLGVPILAGLATFNNALILEGAIPSALLALMIDRTL